MAQDPCAFNFIYTNYSDEKALFANFRHLQEHLNRIGCGGGGNDLMEVIIAANDSSAEQQARADVVCDGVDDQVEWQAAFDQVRVNGGVIGVSSGTYNFSNRLEISGMEYDVSFTALDGAAILEWSNTIVANPASMYFLVHVYGAAAVPDQTDVTLTFDGITFDGNDGANSGAIIIMAVDIKPHINIRHCVFKAFKGQIIFAERGNDRVLRIEENYFSNCSLTDGGFEAPNRAALQFNRGNFSQQLYVVNNVFETVTTGATTVFLSHLPATGYMVATGNVFINCDVDPFTELSASSAVYHNWINGVYTAGDHTGITHDHGGHTGLADNDHPQYLLHTVADAKGDIVAASAADVWDNLTVGTNNFALFADSAQTLGLQWRNTDRTLNVNVTAVGNITTGEDDLMSYSVPAATLGALGDWVDFNAAGTFAATINNKRLRVKFGATTIFDSGSLAITAATDWSLEGQIIRTGAATQKCFVRLNTSSATLSAYADYSTAAETLANAITLKLTGEATDTNDVVEETLTVRFIPAP